jgi:ribosomal protein S18 acetylase RimI-like enzyme
VSAPFLDGFRIRTATESDVELAAGILRAEERALRGESDWGVEDTIDFWRLANLNRGAWLVETADGNPAAFAAAIERRGKVDGWASVHPDFTGRGLATALLARLEQRAREIGTRYVKVGAFAENSAALRLFERLGYREARHYYQMRIDLDHPPDPPEWPPGITPSAFRLEDARAFHAALNEAFAEEWGFQALLFEEWKRIRLDVPETDFSLWFIARDGHEIAGVARCDPKQDGGGWIGSIGVRKPWRKRGVGLALLRQAFVEFHRRGEPHVGLGVDAQNPTGATRLYEAAGMRVLKEDIIFGKELV